MLTATPDHPTDTSLDAIEACLDPQHVLDACREQWSRVDRDVRVSWQQARRIETLYHPQRYLRVVYVLLDDPSTPSNRYWPEGQLVYLQTPVREPMSRRGGLLTLGDTSVEVYGFPNDRRLRGLRTFAQRETCAARWQEWADASEGSVSTLDPASLQRLLVRYVPEQKWVVRLRAEWTCRSTHRITKQRLAVRSARPSACTTLLARHVSLSKQSESETTAFAVPHVVGARTHEGILAVEWLRGDSLVDALNARGDDEILSGVARRLKTLHRTEVPGLSPITGADLNQRMTSATEDLSSTCPDLAAQLGSLTREFARRVDEIEPSSVATLHGDFHWNQLSIKRERFALLDLERMGIGDPLLDVANFATQLEMLGHRPEQALDSETAERWRTAFLDHWASVCGNDIDTDRLSCYAALSRLELARGMMRHLRPGWRSLTQRCVELAGDDLSRPGSGGSAS